MCDGSWYQEKAQSIRLSVLERCVHGVGSSGRKRGSGVCACMCVKDVERCGYVYFISQTPSEAYYEPSDTCILRADSVTLKRDKGPAKEKVWM